MADALRTELDLTLTKEEAEGLASFIDTELESDEDAVRLLIGDGHSGYGLYASCPDYPEEGAILIKTLPEPDGVALPDGGQRPDETYLAYLARCEREGRNTKPQAKDPDLCREPGCTNPTETPVSAWCREHDRKGAFPHA